MTQMSGRSPDEAHRVATPLELLYDLVFVVAVAQAAAGLHHAVAEQHTGDGVTGFVMAFFAIWWAWMNFTWFASAYDTDDVPYRLAVFVQMTGALVIAAGVPRAMDSKDFGVVTLGYVIMRLAAVPQWLRAAAGDPEHRTACLRYAAGISVVQLGWVVRLALPETAGLWAFPVLVAAELAVPYFAEHRQATTWHPHHIAERYGLFTIIVLGESILASTVAVQQALDDDVHIEDLATTAIGGLFIVFSMWWLYFSKSSHDLLTSLRASLRWGYGHYAIFASAAAVGAGIALAVDQASGHSHAADRTAAAALTIPVAVFVLTVWLLHLRPHHAGGLLHAALFPAAAALILVMTFTSQPVLLTGLILAAAVVAGGLTARGRTPVQDATG
ncbi:low temperature requirement protein A [Streptomyces sp. NPDC051940]|uniref:low temperature requirement protein A n=1 Tax=Streptomyces sp. NPDC051940 TaxID=3155675 RepID=UPI0034156D9A